VVYVGEREGKGVSLTRSFLVLRFVKPAECYF
jgi:hypothetical protein